MDLYEEAGAGIKITASTNGFAIANSDGSSFFLTKICDMSFTIQNAVDEIKKLIDEHGGDKKAEMHLVLEDVTEIIDEIRQTRRIPKRKRFYVEVLAYSQDYGWFCSAIISLIGRSGLTILGGE